MAARFEQESRAYAAFAKLMGDATACRGLFDQAHLPLPDALLRFFGEAGAPSDEPKTTISAPVEPERPDEAKEGWFWVPTRDMSATGLVRGVLRANPDGLSPKQIIAEILNLGTASNPGSIANIGTRLKELREIERIEGVWRLIRPETAPLIFKGNGWGPKDAFESFEIAAHRRNCIVHLLKARPDGLQIMQMVNLLEGQPWFHAPLSKDLVKVDMQVLDRDNRAKRVGGGSGKWKVTT